MHDVLVVIATTRPPPGGQTGLLPHALLSDHDKCRFAEDTPTEIGAMLGTNMSNQPTENAWGGQDTSLAGGKSNASQVPFNGTPAAFKERCATFLVVLCNDKDMEKAAGYLDPDCVLIHEDHPPVKGPKAFIEAWQKNLASMPDYHKNIKDSVVEMEEGNAGVARVWVYSQITGIVPGATTDSIDMMRFSAAGLFLESKDVQRTIKQP